MLLLLMILMMAARAPPEIGPGPSVDRVLDAETDGSRDAQPPGKGPGTERQIDQQPGAPRRSRLPTKEIEVKPNLKAVPNDVELDDDFAEDVVQMELHPDRKMDVLEDVHRKEVAFCSQQIANNDRKLRTRIRGINDEIKRLQRDQEQARAENESANAVLTRRKTKAEAYLSA